MKAAVALALCLAATLAGPAAAAPGDFDRSFGHRGVVRTGMGGADHATGLTLVPGGRIVVFGRADVTPGRSSPGTERFALAGYTSTGLLDAGFGTGGKVTWSIGPAHDGLTSAALQPDGKLLVAGWSMRHTAPFALLVLARLDPAGRLDPTFGDGGSVTAEVGFGYPMSPTVVRPLGDGRILLASAAAQQYAGTSSHVAQLRFLSDGRPDPGFGEGGRRVVPFRGGTGYVARVAADAEGRVVAFGATAPASTEDVAAVRYTPAGDPDPSFGDGGEVVLSRGNYDYPDALLIDRDGGVLVSGQVDVAGRGPYLTRLGPDGRPDPAFGEGGTVVLPFPAKALALDRSGRILLGDDEFRLARYSRTGERDRRFALPKLPSDLGGNPLSVAVQPDGRILAVGFSIGRQTEDPLFDSTGLEFAVARFHGGDDFRPPRIRIAGGRPRGCLRGRTVLRVRVRDRALREFEARLDGRTVVHSRRGGARYAVPVRAGRLRPGRHRLVLLAGDASDNRTVLRLRLRRCR